MKVYRQVKMNVEHFEIGDSISIKLKGMGKFEATVQKVYEDGSALFIFDDCVDDRPMNENGKNDGGFDFSDLRKWMNTTLLSAFPKKIRSRMMDVRVTDKEDEMLLRVPTRSEMFGQDENSKYYEEDNGERLVLMENRCNRVCMSPADEYCWYWLWNRRVCNPTFFASVSSYGNAFSNGASGSYGVRPAFRIRNL